MGCLGDRETVRRALGVACWSVVEHPSCWRNARGASRAQVSTERIGIRRAFQMTQILKIPHFPTFSNLRSYGTVNSINRSSNRLSVSRVGIVFGRCSPPLMSLNIMTISHRPTGAVRRILKIGNFGSPDQPWASLKALVRAAADHNCWPISGW